MGRLVLNVLLSFAQFEREMISERTSDKMCATRRKGKRLGGPPVLGYNVDRERNRLILNPEEAKMVRQLFELYLKEQSMLKVAVEANRRGWKTKSWTSKNGRHRKGLPFDKAKLQRILADATYTGQVLHKGKLYPGEHPAVISAELFDRVQTLIRKNTHSGAGEYRHPHCALLKNLIRCGNCGAAMAHTYAKKKNRLYRYYQCTTKQKQGRGVCDTRPLPAQELEDFVADMIRCIGNDPELTRRAFAETLEHRANRQTELDQKRGRLFEKHRQIESRINQLLAAIESSDSDLQSVSVQLKKAEDELKRVERELDSIDHGLESLRTQALDEAKLADALTRFDSLWEVLQQRERIVLIHQLIESIEYNPLTSDVSLRFRMPDEQ